MPACHLSLSIRGQFMVAWLCSAPSLIFIFTSTDLLSQEKKHGGLSSFGFGGTNTHAAFSGPEVIEDRFHSKTEAAGVKLSLLCGELGPTLAHLHSCSLRSSSLADVNGAYIMEHAVVVEQLGLVPTEALLGSVAGKPPLLHSKK